MPRNGATPARIAHLEDPVARDLAARGTLRSYARGSLILREGDAGNAFFVILAGRVSVFVANASGREFVLCHYGPEETFGEMSLDGKPRTASVRAMEPTACAVIERSTLLAALRVDPEVGLRLIMLISARARRTTIDLKDLALMDVYGRVARLLLAQETFTGPDGLAWSREALTQQEIANRVGASRDMISRILKDLRTGGYIAVRERHFTILRRPPARW